jgi:hypothetical protein
MNMSSQKKLDMYIDLDILTVVDTASIKMIDSVLFTKEVSLYKGDYTLNMIVKKDPNLDVYLLGIYLFPYGEIMRESEYWGILYLNETPIMLVKGCNPNSLLKKMTEKRRFNYYIYENNVVVPGEYPSWFFLYSHKSIKYLDLPEWLVRRLGFEYCE